ncbi:MAG: hypothetical protein ABIS86_22455 [Streptosporangiaceae bacterium]
MAEVLSSGPEGPRRTVPRWAVVGAVVLAAAGVGAYQLRGEEGAARPSAPPSLPESVALPLGGPPAREGPAARVGRGETPGLLIDGPTSGAVNRVDRGVATGPWSVTVRRFDGSFGRHGAVVTFPVPAAVDRAGSFLWRLGNGFARVRGDLSAAELKAVADATTVGDGRPVVRAPHGFTVVSSGRYRGAETHETRYGAQDLAEADALGDGLVFTGVTRGGWFEDELYLARADYAGTVHARTAVASVQVGGNGGIAWEPAPGVVAYLGYSGSEFDRAAIEALLRLGVRSSLVPERDWRALHPQKVDTPVP